VRDRAAQVLAAEFGEALVEVVKGDR
jgi:hypothetical protein